jgi:hypothetical protein
MLTSEGKRKLAAAGMFAMPIVLVWATGVMFGGPASVKAEPAPVPVAPPTNPVPVSANIAPEIKAAIDHIAASSDVPFGATPFLHGRRPDDPGHEDPELEPLPEFTLKAVMASSTGNRALIDGRAYRVNDTIADTTWIVTAIDALSRTVTLEDPESKRAYTLEVDRPGF